jgi:hypothetical protein
LHPTLNKLSPSFLACFGYDASMKEPKEEFPPLSPADFPDFPPMDETGDVDLSVLDCNLRKSVAERLEQHHRALELVRVLQSVRRKQYGPDEAYLQET